MSDDGNGPMSWQQRARAAWFAVALALVCTAAFLATVGICAASSDAPGAVVGESFIGLASCKPALEQLGALSVARVWVDGEWWRIATTGLLHGSWIHLILNIWSLWSVGEWAQRAWGATRTAGLFVLGSLAGALASMAWAEAQMVVGASAGVLALAGALLVGRLFGSSETRERLAPVSPTALVVTLILMFAIGLVVPVIAQAGHVGGFAAGIAATWAGMQRGWMRGAVAMVFALAGNELVHIAARPDGRPRYNEFVGYRELDRGDLAKAGEAFERALARGPEGAEQTNGIAYGLALAGVRLSEADALVDQALATDPENPSYVDTKGWIACRRGAVSEGLLLLQQAAAADEVGPSAEIEGHVRDCASASIVR
jgi:membrane associated rhomboid family serine protease